MKHVKTDAKDLARATADLAAWRKNALRGTAAVPGMRAAVEKMLAAAKVNAIVSGRQK